MKHEFLVTIDVPPMATYTDAAKYIKDAVQVHCDNLSKRYPMSALNKLKIKARPIYGRNEVRL